MSGISRRRKLLFGLVALTLAVLIAGGIVEVFLRLVWTPPSFRSDRPFGAHGVYGMAPLPSVSGRLVKWEYDHPFVHNAQRLRAKREFTAELPDARDSRVLFLGDSFTYGLGSGDDETFVHLVDEALERTEVINSGCNGYGQREQLAVLDTLGESLRPDLVVLMFFWNDLEDNSRRTKPEFRLDSEGRVERADRKPRAREKFDPLAHAAPADLEKMRTGGLYLERVLTEGLKGLRYRIFGIKERSITTGEEKEAAWEVTERLLGLAQKRCEEIGTRLFVVSIPDHNRVDPGARIRGIEPIHFEIEDRLAEICARIGVDHHDPTEAMRRAREDSDVPLYYYADRHLTPRGNAALAEVLVPLVSERLEDGVEP